MSNRAASVNVPTPTEPRLVIKRQDGRSRDTTPPDDYDSFIELQQQSFAAMKKFADKRRSK